MPSPEENLEALRIDREKTREKIAEIQWHYDHGTLRSDSSLAIASVGILLEIAMKQEIDIAALAVEQK